MKTARIVHYEGRVQGVGFRWSVRNLAAGFEVAGDVRNLPDGRVMLRVQGEGEEVEAFLEAVRSSHLAAHIKKEEAALWVIAAGEEPRGFRIVP